MRCDAVEPESGAQCVLPEGQHQWHTGDRPGVLPPEGVDWLNEDYVSPRKPLPPDARRKKLAGLKHAVATGSTDLAVMEAAWEERKPIWVAHAKHVLHEFCATHSEPFTTPEDIWPLLEWPVGGEMCAMVIPVRHALKRRWMREVDYRRLSEVYTTADGHTFEMNKVVPIYQSLIAREF